MVIDESSQRVDEIAMAIMPSEYKANLANLDALRAASIWQSFGHTKGKDIGLAAATLGWSAVFSHASVSRDLVKQFHHDVIH